MANKRRVHIRRHDSRGRSKNDAPEYEPLAPFVMIPKAMLDSDPYRALSINARKVMDRLHIEHMNHAGTMNGELITTYGQFEQYGVTRENIRISLDELVALGFLEITTYGGRYPGDPQPHKYRLTSFPTKTQLPTYDWRKHDKEQVIKIKKDLAATRSAAKAYRAARPRELRRLGKP